MGVNSSCAVPPCASPKCESTCHSCKSNATLGSFNEWRQSRRAQDEVIQDMRQARGKDITCHLRIIQVSDVYKLENLPALRTLVQEESEGIPPENVVTVLPGDFLAPSLLSSLDAGFGMIKMMNMVPINLVCFGNHDGNDIAHGKLVHRIEEFRGKWLNSNIPDFDPELPFYSVRELTGKDGTQGFKKVGFLGFCIGGGKWQAMYREDAFGGAHRTIVPVLDAVHPALERIRKDHPDLDEVVPLTHQDMAEDVEMAKMELFPVILGGHDHDQMLETHGERKCKVVKPGMDATHAAIIDIEWTSQARPLVSVIFKDVGDYQPDQEAVDLMEKAYRPVRELEQATLYELPRGETLSSVNARYGDVTLAQKLCDAVRDCLQCDAALINSGTVRGNKLYKDDISYGDLKSECPFGSPVVVVAMPFDVLAAGVKRSRKPWWDIPAGQAIKECAAALQVDTGTRIKDHEPVTIKDEAPEPDNLYFVACDTYVLRKNEVFKAYCKEFPTRVPPADSGRPLLPILVEFFCALMWKQLIEDAGKQVMSNDSICEFKSAVGNNQNQMTDLQSSHTDKQRFRVAVSKIFALLDTDHDGEVDLQELQQAVKNILGGRLSSNIVVEQMLQMVDQNDDGRLSEDEMRTAVMKLLPQ